MHALDELFSPGARMEASLSGFELRPGQIQMARAVERGFAECRHTIVEAGTGVGKSLAYLVPALRSGKKVVVSTGTIALQEQLLKKDIPLALRVLDIPARVTVLKGRNNYLCKQKLERVRSERLLAPSRDAQVLWEWGSRTQSGDRAELPFVPSFDEWEQLDADADDCIGEICPHFRDCFFYKKRDESRYADIVVVNHALFFSDLAMGGGLLPPYDLVVLDEAHQCERWATAALTATLSRSSLERLMRRLHRTYSVPANFEAELGRAVAGLEEALSCVPGERYPLEANEDAASALEPVRETLYRLENWLHANWHTASRKRFENDAEAQRRRDLSMRGILSGLATIDRAQMPGENAIAWVERAESGERRVSCAPFEVGDFLEAALFSRAQSVVLTSATIASDTALPNDAFAFFKRSLGIDDAQELIAKSPFDYPEQARLYVAPSNVDPKREDFSRFAAPIIEECLDRSGGRAFVLFTSYARLREIYGLLRERIAFPARLQGDLSRSHLLDWFRRTPGAVLFATATFWEGIDVVGEQLVVRHYRPASVPFAGGSRRASAHRGVGSKRPEWVRALYDSVGDRTAQAGLWPAHPQPPGSRARRAVGRARAIVALRLDHSQRAAARHSHFAFVGAGRLFLREQGLQKHARCNCRGWRWRFLT